MEKEKAKSVPVEELVKQADFSKKVRAINEGKTVLATVITYGCQQNEADSDRLRGMLRGMGYEITEERGQADVILFNTCAVREHAELKVFGNIGALKHQKAKNPGLIIGLCGCMMQQKHRIDEIMEKYPQIDMIFGTHTFYKLPELLYCSLCERRRVVEIDERETEIIEELPVQREDSFRAWVTVMYGCNNFCTYCVVPHVRGRERSRAPEKIVEEIRGLVQEGYKEITLLGQNVNSYGKDIGTVSFPELLRRINGIEGDFLIRFMTSHPKDAGHELIDMIASLPKVAKQLHLPVQAGSDRVLQLMNRRYTAAEYTALAGYAKEKVPGIVLTSDIIVGFPTETDEDFEDTLRLIKKVEFDSLYTFAYSKRRGTAAAGMEGQVSKEAKSGRLQRLMDTQAEIAKNRNMELEGTTQRVLVEGISKTNQEYLTGRTNGGKLVHFKGDISLAGQFVDIKIDEVKTWSLYGRLIEWKEETHEY